jgi:outer membrane protein OmpA-like peptidoglycan-associated protein
MRKTIALAALGAALNAAPAFAQHRDNKACTENPVFAKFPNSVYSLCERSRFTKLQLYLAKDPAKPHEATEPVGKEGEYWHYIDNINPDAQKKYPSQLEIFRNFENALKQAGGAMLGADGDRSFAYRLSRPSGEYWGQVGCGAGSAAECTAVQHKIVRLAAMEQGVVVSADQIRKSLADTGKVVFYGIYFDTDKAVLKPESGPTLEQMAKFLKANAAAKVFVVGHTDNQGALDRNQKLSRERAAAVVAALAASHGIAKERMVADGVGPLAPVAANDAEAGRARNRRVEMVLR